MKRFEDKVALVTGATNGIGRATAVRLASEGALVAVNKRPTGDASGTLGEIKEAGGEGFEVVADMSEPQQIVDMVQAVAQRAGHIDYLVSNAAINPLMPWNETTFEQWDLLCNTNLRGTWVVATETAKQMIAEGHGGAMVCVSSISAHVGSPFQSAYCATKGGISMLAKALGSVLGTNGIRVNCVEPGAILTNMSAPMMDEPDILKYYVDRIALHRIGDPSEMAGVIAFLLSEDASYVTAATLLADAGFIVNAELPPAPARARPKTGGQMTLGSNKADNPLERRRALVREMYGDMVGRRVEEVPTPALLVDLAVAEGNIARMAAALETMPAKLRPHIKVHKSVELATRQVAAGAIGLSVATVWEAVALAWAGLDSLFVVNTVSHPSKIAVLADLARNRHVMVAVDELANAATLSRAAGAAGSELGVMIEIDDGMDRAGVDAAEDAVALAKEVLGLEHLRLEGITGYEGHCSLEFDPQLLVVRQRAAMDMFLEVADRLESLGIPCPIRSAGGTVSWKLTAQRPGVTEIQAGSYVLMDNFHGRRVPGGFEHALTVATTVISRAPNRLIVDAGNKSVGVGGGPTIVGVDLEALRFDEEHGIFVAEAELDLPVGSWLRLIPGYAPGTVNMYDNYYVVADDRVVDIWPVFPRGPGHNGLVEVP